MLGRGNVYRAIPHGGFGPGRGLGMHLFPFGGFFMVLLWVIVTGVAIYALWHAFRKAGLNGEWSLLALIPVVGIPAALLVLAFERWPVLSAAPAVPSAAPVTTTEGETVLVPTVPMTPPTEPVVPAAAPETPSADASSAPTEPIEGVKKPRQPKDE